MPQYHIWTIGCQMNKADSEYVATWLEQAGYLPTTDIEKADFVMLNTCVVRKSAEDKVVNKLHSLKSLKARHPDITIALAGCLVDSDTNDLKRRFPWVDIFLRPQQWEVLFNWAEGQGLGAAAVKGYLVPAKAPVTALVPIIHGCDSFCSYCIVPYRRGREKSRDPDEIYCQVESLVQRGTREVTLLGQSVGSYGHDLNCKPDLADLLRKLNGIEGLRRIRFLTNHPEDMSHKLMETVAELEKVCEHISLPIQAGDNDILRAMGRGYTVEQYQDLVQDIRLAIPDVALSSDVIVGFPGETEAQFERTLDVLSQVRFDRVHVAVYSPRPGTVATREFEDSIPTAEKQLRLRRVESVHESISAEINAGLVSSTVEVLVEGRRKGKWQGRTRQDKLVFFSHNGELTGQVVPVEIDKASAWALQGRMR